MFTVSQNDYGYYITDTLLNNDGTVFDLTSYTDVQFHVWHASQPGTLLVNGTASVVAPTLGTVRYFVAQADFAIPAGAYKQEWEATLSGCKQSFPTAGNTIIVQESP